MVIKQSHSNVQNDGKVNMPYLANWSASTSTLTELVQYLSAIFSQDPPLYTKPPGYTPSRYDNQASSYPISSHSGREGAVIGVSINGVTGYPNLNASHVNHSDSIHANSFSNNQNSTLSRREKLEKDLTSKLQSELHNVHLKLKKELDDEFNTQRLLQESLQVIRNDANTLFKLKADFERSLNELEQKSKELEEWGNEMASKGPLDPESLLEPYDAISAQLVRLTAEQKAIDDIIYCLETAKQENIIDLATFMKETRKLTKQQFLSRMHVMKINASISQSVTTKNN
jgi:ESCRT-I complex subunit TSG101